MENYGNIPQTGQIETDGEIMRGVLSELNNLKVREIIREENKICRTDCIEIVLEKTVTWHQLFIVLAGVLLAGLGTAFYLGSTLSTLNSKMDKQLPVVTETRDHSRWQSKMMDTMQKEIEKK
jgi:hypothetical protein